MRLPRIVIGAASSGAGKTSLAIGIMGALSGGIRAGRGLDVRPFKIGPDYIDSGLHARVLGRPSRNLDATLMGQRAVVESLTRNGAGGDIAVIEGVMGYYDGEPSATADVASLIRAPAIIAIDAQGAAESCAATALGFVRYRRRSGIRAFVLNRVGSEAHYAMAASAIERATGLPVIGYLPNDRALSMPERHLGLAGDGADFMRIAEALAMAVAAHIDLDALLAIASAAPDMPDEAICASMRSPRHARDGEPEIGRPPADGSARPIVAIARDEAFSFYYQDNIDTLESLGAKILYFSPLRDAALPEGAAALYLGGGYPELYAAALEANGAMRGAIRDAADSGLPIYSECGGYLYLLERLDDMVGTPHAGCGLFTGRARMGTRLAALGYRDCRTLAPSLAGPAGTRLSGHVFHYATVTETRSDGTETAASNPTGSARLVAPALAMKSAYCPDAPPALEGASYRSAFGSFLHVHFAANPALARRIVAAARRYAAHGFSSRISTKD